MRIFLSLLPKYQNYTSVLASIIHLRSDTGFFVNPQRISETTHFYYTRFWELRQSEIIYPSLPAQSFNTLAPLRINPSSHPGFCADEQEKMLSLTITGIPWSGPLERNTTYTSCLIVEAEIPFWIILHSVRRSLCAFKPIFTTLHLPRISKNAESDADFVCDLFSGKHIGQEFIDQLLIVLLMRAV